MSIDNILSGRVGAGAGNRQEDVRLIQHLLNDWLGNQKKELLKVDGICGPKTQAGIDGFQRSHMSIQDGVIDINGPTIHALIEQHLGRMVAMIKPMRSIGAVDSSTAGALMDDKFGMQFVRSYLDLLRRSS